MVGYGSGSAKMMPIRPDLDPQNCFYYLIS